MKLYVDVKTEDVSTMSAGFVEAIEPWLNERPQLNAVIERGDALGDEEDLSELVDDMIHDTFIGAILAEAEDDQQVLSVHFQAKRSVHMKDLLNQLYDLAKKYKCDYELGLFEGEKKEAVCYFGHSEGKPDYFEFGSYLGLN